MGGIGDVVAGLHAAISEGNDAIQCLRLAHEALDDAARGMYDVAYGTNDQDLAMVHDQLTTAVDDIELLTAGLTAARGRVGDLIAHYSGDAVDHDLDQGNDQGDTTPPPPPVRSPHGDLYPPGTEWAVDRLPPFSPLNSNQPVRGVMRIDGGEPINVKPGSLARLGIAARRRLDEQGQGAYRSNAHHVEILAAMSLIKQGGSTVDVVVNRGPCGLFDEDDRPAGCHQLLAMFLPRGTRLRLFATLGDRVFTRVYEGEADND